MPKLVTKEYCTGCTACMNICLKHCIEMKSDAAGFVFPEITDIESCVECNSCERTCSVIKKEICETINTVAYAAYSKDEMIRTQSSSGGVFSEISKEILKKNGVIYGASYNDKFEVQHCCIDNADDLWRLRGAKYSESDLGVSFADILVRLKQGQHVLFSGTPCQVAGLKSFLKKDYDNLLCVDFVCHGVPSPMAWQQYVKYRSEKDAAGQMPQKINLRSKISGWSRYRYSNLYEYPDGKSYTALSGDDLYMKLFVGDYISRESCSNCEFKGYSRVSDITLGDFWGIWDLAPEMDDNKGTSLVLIQSEKGRDIFSAISDRVQSKEMTLEQASEQNPSIIKSSPAKANREEVLDMIRAGRIGELESMFTKPEKENISIFRKVIRRLKRL